MSCSPPVTTTCFMASMASSSSSASLQICASTRSISGKSRSTSCTRAGNKELVASKTRKSKSKRRRGGGDSGSDDEERWQFGGGDNWGPIDGSGGGSGAGGQGGRGKGMGGSGGSNEDWDSWMSRSGYSDGTWWVNLAMYDSTWAWQLVCALSLLQALWFALPGRSVKPTIAAVA
ncbi:MAG: hypothetical protein WDW38_002899 [Sanguina aurantia]